MTVGVPSLEGSLYLTDPQSIIGYTLKRYFRQPKDTIPILPDLIISLPWQVAKFGDQPEVLAENVRTDLNNVLSRIFGNDRSIEVSTMPVPTGDHTYNIDITVMFAKLTGELDQVGMTISLKEGKLVIPEDTLVFKS